MPRTATAATSARMPTAPSAPDDGARARLLAAALELVRGEGIQAFTQARVAEAAGLRQSHLTYYFPKRSDLLTAIVEHGADTVLQLLGSSGGPVSLAGLRRAMAKQLGDSDMPRLMLGLTVASDEDPSLKAWLATFEQRMKKHFRSMFARFGVHPPATDLALFHATLIGLAVLSLQAQTERSTREARRLMFIAFDRLVASAAAPAPSPVRRGRR